MYSISVVLGVSCKDTKLKIKQKHLEEAELNNVKNVKKFVFHFKSNSYVRRVLSFVYIFFFLAYML